MIITIPKCSHAGIRTWADKMGGSNLTNSAKDISQASIADLDVNILHNIVMCVIMIIW